MPSCSTMPECRRRHHGRGHQPSVPPAFPWPADDGDATRRFSAEVIDPWCPCCAAWHSISALERRCRRCCLSARKLTATPRPIATSALFTRKAVSRIAKEGRNMAFIWASSRNAPLNLMPPSFPSATRCSRCVLPTSATRRCCGLLSSTRLANLLFTLARNARSACVRRSGAADPPAI